MATTKKPFKYKGRDLKSIKNRATQSGGDFDNYVDTKGKRFKVEAGENQIRIMPPSPTINQDKWGDQWGIEIWVHDYIGPDKSNFLCLKKMKKEPCPLCDARDDIDEDDEDAEELQRKLKPKKKILCYVIDRDNEKEGPQVWAMPWTVEKDIQARSYRKKTNEAILIDDPDEGFDISFEKTGQGRKTRYIAIEIDRDPSALSDKASTQQKWLDFITENALPDILKFHDPEYMDQVFRGKHGRKPEDEDEDEDKDEDEDEDEKPKSKKKAISKKRSRGEDEDDNQDLDDEDEDEKPKSKRRARDEEEDEEDEDEDERPSRAKSAGSRKRRGGGVKSADRDQEDEDEDEDTDEDEDEDEDATRAVSKLKKRHAKKDEEEDEDEEDEDEDEDEKPKSRRMKRTKPKRRSRDEDEDEDED